MPVIMGYKCLDSVYTSTLLTPPYCAAIQYSPCSRPLVPFLVSAASVSPALFSDTSSLASSLSLAAVSFRLWQHHLGLCFSECLK